MQHIKLEMFSGNPIYLQPIQKENASKEPH